MPDSERAERPANRPWAYFITFSCYGTRLHGRDPYSVSRRQNGWKTPLVAPSKDLLEQSRRSLREEPVRLNAEERQVVLDAIIGVCDHCGFDLYAAHVRSDHVHVVVEARDDVARLLLRFKAYASRALNRRFGAKARRWTEHGSTVHLWRRDKVDEAIDYVLHRQGAAMAVAGGYKWNRM